jgi:hypothetical protein
MVTFFSPRAYRHGVLAMTLAGSYLAVVALLVAGAAAEGGMSPSGDGGFMSGFAMLATFPLSLVVMASYTGIATAQGIPPSDQYPGWWVLAAFAICGVVNAVVVWVFVRGRRQGPLVEVPPGTPQPWTVTNDPTIT